MTNVVESDIVEFLTEAAPGIVVETTSTSEVIETTATGPDILAEITTTETLTDTVTETVYAVDPQITLVDVAEQGPPGAAGLQGPSGGVSYPGKTVVYAGDVVSEVLMYSDAAKTQLAERRVMTYVLGKLSVVQFFDGSGAISKTRTLIYTSGILTSVVDT